MATITTKPELLVGAVVVDASVASAICAKEALTEPVALAALAHYRNLGYEFFAPAAIASEVLYVLCRKQQDGFLDASGCESAVADLEILLNSMRQRANGDADIVVRAAQIRGSYTCRRSTDSLYIALADTLSRYVITVLVTFDKELPKQAAANAPAATVRLLTV